MNEPRQPDDRPRDRELRSWMDAWQGGDGAPSAAQSGRDMGEGASPPSVGAQDLGLREAGTGSDMGRGLGRGLGREERRRLRRRMRRWTWWMGFEYGLETLLAVGATAWLFLRARQADSLLGWTHFVLVQVLLAVAFGFTWWNRRGTWRPKNQSTRAHLGLEILRARRKLRAATHIMPLFLAFELALLLPWKLWQLSVDPGVLDMAAALRRTGLLVGIVVVAVLFGCWLAARRFRADLEALRALRRQLDGPDAPDRREDAATTAEQSVPKTPGDGSGRDPGDPGERSGGNGAPSGL